MRILVTNDDGIDAGGLQILEAIAAEVAGPAGEIWTVAPAFEQSGVGHCISYTRPMMIAQLGPRRFAAEGSPADCVLAGIYDVLKGVPPDLVLSGVNRGNNSAENTLYSGTVGGTIEGALHGITAIALSQYFGQGNSQTQNPYEAAQHYGPDIIRRILRAQPPDQSSYRLFYNVNFPPFPAAQVKGVRVAAQGFREGTRFSVVPHPSPGGKRFLRIQSGNQHIATAPFTDAAMNLQGYVSVTPMRADLTAYDSLETLKSVET
ncbi:MAG: 5'/3'-nucleotidase SurE [Rhodobacteraceae bacterium]|nr:5'/3'-nucleotidase SurE [Paracoccaceae bacterium]